MVILGFRPAAEVLEAYVFSGAPTALTRTSDNNESFALYNTPVESATLTHVGAHIAEGADGSRQVKVCVYSSAGALLGSAVMTPAVAATGQILGELNVPVAVSVGQTYRLAFQVSNGNLRLSRENVSLSSWINNFTVPAFSSDTDPFVDGATTGRGKVAIWAEASGVAAAPDITGVAPSLIGDASIPVISGINFGAVPAAVLLSPTNDRTNVAATAQTIGAGAGDTTIPTTGVVLPVGAANGDTLWYFVQAEDLSWSDGFAVTYGVQPTLTAPEVFNATLDGFSFRFTTDTANGTAIWAAYATTTQRNAATIADIQAEITTPATSLARGQFTVTVAGVQTVSAITGLGAAQTRHIRVFHDGDVTV